VRRDGFKASACRALLTRPGVQCYGRGAACDSARGGLVTSGSVVQGTCTTGQSVAVAVCKGFAVNLALRIVVVEAVLVFSSVSWRLSQLESSDMIPVLGSDGRRQALGQEETCRTGAGRGMLHHVKIRADIFGRTRSTVVLDVALYCGVRVFVYCGSLAGRSVETVHAVMEATGETTRGGHSQADLVTHDIRCFNLHQFTFSEIPCTTDPGTPV
jgi:hypothetical protein